MQANMNSKYKKDIVFIANFTLIFLPKLSFAALLGLEDFLKDVLSLINLIVPVLIAMAVAFFFWGMILFIKDSGNDKSREEGKQKMLWGIVALFVMVSIFGILNFLSDVLNIDVSSPLPAVSPTILG